MKYCNKCGEEPKDNAGPCSGCKIKADIDNSQHPNGKKTSDKLTDTLHDPSPKSKKNYLSVLMMIGIIILALILIFIFVFIWQAFADASNHA